jgi:hypothetical protein
MRRRWKTVVLAVTVGVVALSVVAVAYGVGNGRTAKLVTGARACGALMSNPQALEDMHALSVEHQKDMQAWFGQYGAAPSSAEAQAALQKLRQDHWNDMRALFQKYGVKVPQGRGPGAGPTGAVGRGGCLGGGPVQGTGYGMMGSGAGMMGGWN